MAQMIDEESNKKEAKGAAVPKARKRKGVDKWKTKKWFTVLAPAMFNNVSLGQTPAEDPENVMNRTIAVSAREITGNIKKSQLMLQFRVNNVQGLNAYTQLAAIMVQPSSVRRLVRRRTSKVESVDDVTCKDGVRARVKSVALVANQISAPKRAQVRVMLREGVQAVAGQHDYEALLQQFVTGEPINGVVDKARKIAPMKRVDVLKVTRLSA
jgi:small subunit ribosomal protein S3Ae